MSNKAYFVHESSDVDENVEIGEGTKIQHFSHIQSGARIGRDCVLGQNAYISNNVIIGDVLKIQNNVSVYEGITLENYVFCGPFVVFTNILMPRSKYPQYGPTFYQKTLVKEGATLGANGTVICGVTIGRHAMIGAGSVVHKDVPDFALVVGVPARRIGWMSEAGHRLSFDAHGLASCPKSGLRYRIEKNLLREMD